MTEDKIVRKLRLQLEAVLAKQKDDQAIPILLELVKVDPKSTRWPHKLGDLFRKQKRKKEAIEYYAIAADLYQDQGFLARAIAIAKAVIDIDPRRIDVLERIDPEAARKLHSPQRPPTISLRPGSHSAIVAEEGSGARSPSSPRMPTRHPAPLDEERNWHPSIIPEGPAPARHPAVVLEDDAPIAPRPARDEAPARHRAIIPEDASRAHHAVIPQDTPAPARHRAVIPEDAPRTHHAVIPEQPAPARHRAVIPESDPPPARASSPDRRAPRERPPARNAAATLDGGDVALAPPPATARVEPSASSSARVASAVLAAAPELTPAPDAEEHEVRFSDVPPAEAVKVGLSEQEIAPREAARPSLLPEPSPYDPEKLASLPLFPLFAEIAQPALRELITSAEVLELDDAALVYQRGDAADALYGIVEGSVELKFQAQGPGTTLAEGDVFGESCLLTGEKRHADVVVRGRLVALKFPRAKLAQLAGANPRVTELLLELLTRRLMTNLVQSSPLFHEFDAHARQDLIGQFEIRRAARGTVLAELGKVSDGLYISLTGALDVSFGDGRPSERHVAGTMFGQASLLSRTPSDVRVSALSHMLVLRLPLKGFQSIAMQYPSMLAHLSSLAESSVAQVSG